MQIDFLLLLFSAGNVFVNKVYIEENIILRRRDMCRAELLKVLQSRKMSVIFTMMMTYNTKSFALKSASQ